MNESGKNDSVHEKSPVGQIIQSQLTSASQVSHSRQAVKKSYLCNTSLSTNSHCKARGLILLSLGALYPQRHATRLTPICRHASTNCAFMPLDMWHCLFLYNILRRILI